MKLDEDFFSSKSEQPNLLSHRLTSYREVLMMYKFSVEMKPDTFFGILGHVFFPKVREWTLDVGYHNKTKYLMLEHSVNQVHGSSVLPIFNSELEMSCFVVLELVKMKEKPNFDTKIEIVYQSLQVGFALSIYVKSMTIV